MSDGDQDADATTDVETRDQTAGDIVVTLPDSLRSELKDPLGPIYTEAEALLADAGTPLIAVGDIVTDHLHTAGYRPAVALVDGRTKRERINDAVAETMQEFGAVIEVKNPAATLTMGLLEALTTALDREEPTIIAVEGEEDLATLPAILAAPDGAAVVYGQPGEGMVLATVDATLKGEIRTLLSAMEGSHDRLWTALGISDGD